MHDASLYNVSFREGVVRRGTFQRSSPGRSGIRRFGYRFIDDRLLLPHGRLLTPEAADLIDVCVAIAMSDRRAPGNPQRGEPNSVGAADRSLEVTVGLRTPERWMRHEVRQAITDLAEMLTGNAWTMRFKQRSRDRRPAELQRHLPLASTMDEAIVVLHSGGLDSLLGMAAVLSADERRNLVPVSVATNSKTRRLVEGVIGSLRTSFPQAWIRGALLWFQSEGADRFKDRQSAYRTRMLPCLAAGVVVASEMGGRRLQLTENGPGAINLRASVEQGDVCTTRVTHPGTLAAFARLATLVLDREIRIENTGLLKTKGQLAEVLKDSRFEEAARLTVSCERFPYAAGDAPCGACMSCLYRQMALQRVGMTRIDAGRIERRGVPGIRGGRQGTRTSVELVALTLQEARLRKLLATEHPYCALDAEYERIDEVRQVANVLGLTDTEIMTAIVDLYSEFVEEVSAFLRTAVVSFPRSLERAVAS